MPRPLEYREAIKRLKAERPTITEVKQRGKGSHRMIYDPATGVHYPLPYHGGKHHLKPGYLKDLIWRFDLPTDIFD